MTFILRLPALLVLSGAIGTVGTAQQPSRVYTPGEDVKAPIIIKNVNPSYTPGAMHARIQGVVQLELVVLENGRVGDVKVTRSLDEIYGLDRQAVKAAKQSRFKPGTRNGKPVPVRVEMEFTFTLK